MGHNNLKKAMLSGKEFKARIKTVKMLEDVLKVAHIEHITSATVYETRLAKYKYLFFNKKDATFRIMKIQDEDLFLSWHVPEFDIKNDCWVK